MIDVGRWARWMPTRTDDACYADGPVVSLTSFRIERLGPRWDDFSWSQRYRLGDVVERPGGRVVEIAVPPTCSCGNAARYVNQHGALTCGICPLRAGDDSLKIDNVPRLLEWARGFVNFLNEQSGRGELWATMAAVELRDIIQRGPT